MKTLILFLTASFSLLQSANIERTIDSITYRSQIGQTIGLIELSDGSIWKWAPDAYSENYLRKWEPGDKILVKTVNHPGFALQNIQKPHYAPIVSLAFDSYAIFPALQKYERAGCVITLDDGTKWELIYDFNRRTLHHWAKGDRIIAVHGINDTFELINIDIPHENRCQIERAIQVLPYDPRRPRALDDDNL